MKEKYELLKIRKITQKKITGNWNGTRKLQSIHMYINLQVVLSNQHSLTYSESNMRQRVYQKHDHLLSQILLFSFRLDLFLEFFMLTTKKAVLVQENSGP